MSELLDPTWPIAAARAADEKQGRDVVVLEVGRVIAITDHFVIASAPNGRMVRTIVEEIEARIKAAGGPAPVRVEGLTEREWVLMDFATFVVHVFLETTREYYDLERLWRDVPKVDWEAPGDEAASR